MERLTAIAPNGMAYLVKVKPSEQEVESPYPNTLNCILESFKRLAEYEDTGLTPDDIKTYIEAFKRLSHISVEKDLEITRLTKLCDYWEREAKKHCAALGEQKIKLKELECEMCRLVDMEECKQC